MDYTSIQKQIRGITQTLLELCIIVHGFEGSSTVKVLTDKVNQLVEDYQALDADSDKVDKIMIPMDIIAYVEEGRNPDVYTREFMELLQKQNQYVCGKFKAMQSFKEILSADIKDAFPNLSTQVDDILEKTKPN